MSVQDAEKFIEEVRRYTEARRAARQVRNMLANLNAALDVAASKGVDCEVDVINTDECGSISSRRLISVQCRQDLSLNEPADWVLDRFREAAREIMHDRTPADLAAKVQYLVDYLDKGRPLPHDSFTFPDGSAWEPTRMQRRRKEAGE